MKSFPIRTLAELTGVPATTLRTWELRYGLIRPKRTGSGHRRYTAADAELIYQIKDLLNNGCSIRQAIKTIRQTGLEPPSEDESDSAETKSAIDQWAQYQEMMIHAIENYSAENMDLVYNRVLSLYPVDEVMTHLIVPLFEELGRRWDKWEGGIAEEHFASTYLRNKLGVRLNEEPALPSGKPFIATCFPQEQHELGLILFCLAALSQGYRPIYLGPDLPFQQIPSAAESSRSVAVVLSAKFPQRLKKRQMQDLKALGESLTLPIFVGGNFAVDNIQDISACKAIPLELDLKKAIKKLDSMVKKK